MADSESYHPSSDSEESDSEEYNSQEDVMTQDDPETTQTEEEEEEISDEDQEYVYTGPLIANSADEEPVSAEAEESSAEEASAPSAPSLITNHQADMEGEASVQNSCFLWNHPNFIFTAESKNGKGTQQPTNSCSNSDSEEQNCQPARRAPATSVMRLRSGKIRISEPQPSTSGTSRSHKRCHQSAGLEVTLASASTQYSREENLNIGENSISSTSRRSKTRTRESLGSEATAAKIRRREDPKDHEASLSSLQSGRSSSGNSSSTTQSPLRSSPRRRDLIHSSPVKNSETSAPLESTRRTSPRLQKFRTVAAVAPLSPNGRHGSWRPPPVDLASFFAEDSSGSPEREPMGNSIQEEQEVLPAGTEYQYLPHGAPPYISIAEPTYVPHGYVDYTRPFAELFLTSVPQPILVTQALPVAQAIPIPQPVQVPENRESSAREIEVIELSSSSSSSSASGSPQQYRRSPRNTQNNFQSGYFPFEEPPPLNPIFPPTGLPMFDESFPPLIAPERRYVEEEEELPTIARFLHSPERPPNRVTRSGRH